MARGGNHPSYGQKRKPPQLWPERTLNDGGERNDQLLRDGAGQEGWGGERNFRRYPGEGGFVRPGFVC